MDKEKRKIEKALMISSVFCNNTPKSVNAMKNYELLVEQNKIINDILDKINNLDLNIQYIYKLCKEKEKQEDEKNGWFF
jgi:hypothetical protein